MKMIIFIVLNYFYNTRVVPKQSHGAMSTKFSLWVNCVTMFCVVFWIKNGALKKETDH